MCYVFDMLYFSDVAMYSFVQQLSEDCKPFPYDKSIVFIRFNLGPYPTVEPLYNAPRYNTNSCGLSRGP